MSEKEPSVKILVGYHKPAYLLKSDVLVPIHLGRALATEASKDGVMSKEDYQWMLDNMIGDDTGDNISKENRTFAELTGIYWAWKNYDKLGNPDYIGLMHYRRTLKFSNKKYTNINDFLSEKNIYKACSKYDIIVPEKLGAYSIKKRAFISTIKEQYSIEHYAKDIDALEKIIKKHYPELSDSVDKIFYHSAKIHWKGIFVMRKDLFMEYCSFLFDIMNKLEKKSDWKEYPITEQRVVGYLSEFVLNIFMDYIQSKNKRLKIKEFKQYQIDEKKFHSYNGKDIHICFGTDNNYMKHTTTAIASILKNACPYDKYYLYILSSNLNSKNKKLVQKVKKIKDCNIQYLDIDENKLAPFQAVKSYPHLNLSTYNRLMIPELLPQLNKVIYFDSDAIAVDDIAELYNIDIGEAYFAGIKDPFSDKNAERIGYTQAPYINAGITVFNCKQLRKNNYFNKVLSAVNLLKDKALCADQDFINYCFHKNFKIIPQKWNVFIPFNIQRYKMEEPKDSDYIESKNHSKIIHFVGPDKPWNKDCKHPLAAKYWEYRQLTPWRKKHKIFSVKTINDGKKIRFFNMTILKIKKTSSEKEIKFLGIPLWKRKTENNKKSYYFLGLKIYSKKIKSNISKQLNDLLNQIAITDRKLNNLKVCIKAQSMHAYLSKFKNVHKDQDIVLLATGPSVSFYSSALDAIHVGVNGATKVKNVKLDYLFVQDQALDKDMNINADEYNCIKFYGIHADERAKVIYPNVKKISMNSRFKANAYPYLLEDGTYGNFAYDISCEPFGDFCSTVFSALQFILYTNPKRIF